MLFYLKIIAEGVFIALVLLSVRGMNMLFEGLKEKGSMVIVPSSALDSMNLGAIGGLVSLAKMNETENKKEKIKNALGSG